MKAHSSILSTWVTVRKRTLVAKVILVVLFQLGSLIPSFSQIVFQVGNSHPIKSITQAIDSIPAVFTDHIHIQLDSDYVDTNETFPITFIHHNSSSDSSGILIYPIAPGLSISSSASATFLINGGDYISINGSVNMANDSLSLAISNTDTNGCALKVMNNSKETVFEYLILRSVTDGLSANGSVTLSLSSADNVNTTVAFRHNMFTGIGNNQPRAFLGASLDGMPDSIFIEHNSFIFGNEL